MSTPLSSQFHLDMTCGVNEEDSPVLGPPLYLPTPLSSLSMRVRDIHNVLLGGPIPAFDSPVRGTFVDVRDVAELVLRSVEMDLSRSSHGKEPGDDNDDGVFTRERYLLVGQSGVSPKAMAELLREGFPERRGVIRTSGEAGEVTWGFDASTAGRLLGREWTGFRESVIDSARVFLQVGEEHP
jgi:nucleoside-diphosphate-sugar epimerase